MRWIARLLNDGVMGFLAMLMLAASLVPLLFDVSAAAEKALDVAEWIILGLFALEYVADLSISENRAKYLTNPWRILDLLCLLVAFGSVVPSISEILRTAPALRLLRIFRALLFGARAGTIAAHLRTGSRARASERPMRVVRVEAGGARPVDGFEIAKEGWTHVSDLPPHRFEEAAKAAGLEKSSLEAALGTAGYPRLEVGERISALTLWLPELNEDGVRRVPLLLVTDGGSIASFSTESPPLPGEMAGLPAIGFAGQKTLAMLKFTLRRHEEAAGHLEREVRDLEERSIRETGAGFFEETFELKKDLFSIRADLWRLKGLLDSLARGRVRVHGLTGPFEDYVRVMVGEAEYLYETVGNIRENLISLVELKLNVVSYDMNRVMRLLAVVSVLGLVPAVAGGLFGMNLIDNPWNVTLPQLSFGVSMVMLTLLYIFYVKGWLR